MRTFTYVVGGLVAAWIALRLFWFVRKRLRNRRDRRPSGVPCPECGSTRLDDYSDANSGMCLQCNHVWGVEAPGRKQ